MFRYRIADRVVATTVAFGDLAAAGGRRIDWRFVLAPPRRCPDDVDWYHRAVVPPDDRVAQLIGRARGRQFVQFSGLATFVIDPRDRRIVCYPARPSLSKRTVSHLLVAQVMPLVFSTRRLSLHASGVEIGGGAIAFVGTSGQGKSTLAAALAACGFPLVTDDCVLVSVDAGVPRVVPMQVGLRLWPDAARRVAGVIGAREGRRPKRRFREDELDLRLATGRLPLRRLYLLEPRPGGPPRSVSVGGGDAVIALLQATSQLDSDRPATLRRAFDRLTAVVGAAEVRRLIYPQRLSALDRVLALITREAGG